MATTSNVSFYNGNSYTGGVPASAREHICQTEAQGDAHLGAKLAFAVALPYVDDGPCWSVHDLQQACPAREPEQDPLPNP